jgi:hypothetical protein
VKRLLAAALLLGACAASPRRAGPPPTAPAEPADVEQLYADLRNRELEFRNASLATEDLAGCKRMFQLRDNICALAERICRIADKEPAGSQTAAYCTEGQARCKNANDSTQSRGCRQAQLR